MSEIKPESFRLEPRNRGMAESAERKLWRCAKDLIKAEQEMDLDYQKQTGDISVKFEMRKRIVTLKKKADGGLP
jgi:hypothetical protein